MNAKELAERIEALKQDLEGTGAEVVLSSGRPATQIEIEAMTAIAKLQDENRELKGRLHQITREVEAMRQYAIKNSLMIGEIRAWDNLKKLTIYYTSDRGEQ